MSFLKRILTLFRQTERGNSVKGNQPQFKTTIGGNKSSPLTYNVIVAGVSFYQSALEKICGKSSKDDRSFVAQADIIPENDNPHDSHAIRVEINGETVGHLSRKNTILWRSKMMSDNQSGVVKCPANIVWDKNYDEEGSYGVWLNLDLSLSDSKPERELVRTISAPTHHTNDRIEFLVNELNRLELSHCSVGDAVKLWIARDAKKIFIYRKGGGPSEGKLGVCPDDVFGKIFAAPGSNAHIVSIYERGCKIACRLVPMAEIEADETRRTQRILKDFSSPIEYSAIDEGIYKCYISNKTGMCENIGTWEQFRKVEEQIARICQDRNGKYFKGQAKTARFAIIFDPSARTSSNVAGLMEKGYRVTSFEKALEYFGLSDMWDCEKLMKAENDYKRFSYETTFEVVPSKK